MRHVTALFCLIMWPVLFISLRDRSRHCRKHEPNDLCCKHGTLTPFCLQSLKWVMFHHFDYQSSQPGSPYLNPWSLARPAWIAVTFWHRICQLLDITSMNGDWGFEWKDNSLETHILLRQVLFSDLTLKTLAIHRPQSKHVSFSYLRIHKRQLENITIPNLFLLHFPHRHRWSSTLHRPWSSRSHHPRELLHRFHRRCPASSPNKQSAGSNQYHCP